MFLSEVSVRRPVATTMFFSGVLILGVISLTHLSVDLLPNISYPKLTVWTSYRDVPPVEVEELVTVPIEEAVSTIPRVRRLTSVSKEGASLVTLEFLWGTNMDIAALNVREKLDNLRWFLPQEAGRPTILRLDPRSQPIMSLAVTGGSLLELKELTRNVIKRRLEQIKGVALATVTGGFEREIQVEVDSRKLTALGLSIEQVAEALDSANRNLPGGTIKKGRYRYALRTLGEFQDVKELTEVVINRSANGSVLTLKDIANVVDGFKDREAITRFNGNEAIGVVITKETGANTVEVSNYVREVLRQLREEYPGIPIDVASDQAKFISEAISNVLQAVMLGGLLAFLVLFFFLHDVRNPITIAVVIPIAILATFALMYFTNVSLNMISLGGLALGVGMLVDNSIVVLENIFRQREEGADRVAAAIRGAREVAMPVMASTLTTIAVFFPIIYVRGVAGQLFQDQSLTVTYSLLASLLVALTLLPMLTSGFKRQHRQPDTGLQVTPGYRSLLETNKKSFPVTFQKIIWPVKKAGSRLKKFAAWLRGWSEALIGYWVENLSAIFRKLTQPVFRIFDRGFAAFADKYETLLVWSLHHRPGVLVVTAAGLLLAIVLGATLDRRLMPEVDQGEFVVKIELPPGSSLESTSRVVGEIEQTLLHQPEISSVFSQMGLSANQTSLLLQDADMHRARLLVRLKEATSKRTEKVIADLRAALNHIGGAQFTFESSGSLLSQFLGTTESDVAIKISGNDLAVSKNLLTQIQERVKTVPGLTDLHSSYEEGRPEIRISIDREAAGRYGFTARQVAQFVQHRLRGAVSSQFKDFDRKIDILVRPGAEQRNDLEDLLNAQILAGQNAVPLRELVRIHFTEGATEIHRADQARQIVLYGNVVGRDFSEAVSDIESRISEIEHPYDYRISVGGQREEMQRSFGSLLAAFLLSAALVYMILAAQFESLLQPFVISFAVPLAAIGVVLALFLTGQSFNVMSLIGMVVLVGIVVNDAIIKVDFINQEQRRGSPLRTAIMEAGRKRLRPIMMTTATTVLGLLPMALGFGEGAELRRPLAIAVIGGLISATFLTLVVVPVIYSLFVREGK